MVSEEFPYLFLVFTGIVFLGIEDGTEEDLVGVDVAVGFSHDFAVDASGLTA